MNRRLFGALILCVFAALAFLPVFSAQAPVPQPFSADFTSIVTPHSTVTGKFYSSPPLLREDSSYNGHESRTVIYSDGRLKYALDASRHLYSEVHTDEGGPAERALLAEKIFDPDNPCGPVGPTCDKVGTETVEGRLCEKWVTSDKNGTTTTWFDRKLLFPIKRTGPFGFVWQLTNISEGKQDASLFEVPADYKAAVDLSGGVVGGTMVPKQ